MANLPPAQKGPVLRYFYNPEFRSRGLRRYIERNLAGAGFDVASRVQVLDDDEGNPIISNDEDN